MLPRAAAHRIAKLVHNLMPLGASEKVYSVTARNRSHGSRTRAHLDTDGSQRKGVERKREQLAGRERGREEAAPVEGRQAEEGAEEVAGGRQVQLQACRVALRYWA